LKAHAHPGGGAERGTAGEVGKAAIVMEVASCALTARMALVTVARTSFLESWW